ncbi:hypothetical protein GCM10027273_28530 [Nocardioides pakistanensis]
MLREARGCCPSSAAGSYSGPMREYDATPDPLDDGPVEPIAPEDFLGPSGIPLDARLMGFDRNTEEGALIALAGSLDPAKISHKLVAWVLLLASTLPLLLGVARSLP